MARAGTTTGEHLGTMLAQHVRTFAAGRGRLLLQAAPMNGVSSARQWRRFATSSIAMAAAHPFSLPSGELAGAATLLSRHFAPTLRPETLGHEHQQMESLALLIRGGYLRQSSAGHFTLLPNGLRVVKKIEKIIDDEMQLIGASRVEMPTMLSTALWHKSGRLETMGSELYKLRDRRGSEYILAPTCEEEVTKLIGDEIHSWRHLPVRVYQITTKHRDEPRPRSGLLRTRSFLMKDLYTFDASVEEAQDAYKDVTAAYHRIMSRLFGKRGKDWRVALADSGAMGGLQSHEYQVPDSLGEDALFSCDACDYAANAELAASLPSRKATPSAVSDVTVFLYGPADLTAHGCELTALVAPKARKVNPLKLAKVITPSEDGLPVAQQFPKSISATWDWKDRPEGPMVRFDRLRVLLDHECAGLEPDEISEALLSAVEAYGSPPSMADGPLVSQQRAQDAPTLQDYFGAQFASPHEPIAFELVDVRQVDEHDSCAACRKGQLRVDRTVEVGHTFLLGTRYSQSLGYDVQGKDAKAPPAPLQMGCYGIGLTRILGVLAQTSARRFAMLSGNTAKESKSQGKAAHARQGLAWDAAVAPFRALVLPLDPNSEAQMQACGSIVSALQRARSLAGQGHPAALSEIFKALSSNDDGGRDAPRPPAAAALVPAEDIALDDRTHMTLGARLAEADLVGYPLVFLLGKSYDATGHIEVRCRTRDAHSVISIPIDALM